MLYETTIYLYASLLENVPQEDGVYWYARKKKIETSASVPSRIFQKSHSLQYRWCEVLRFNISDIFI